MKKLSTTARLSAIALALLVLLTVASPISGSLGEGRLTAPEDGAVLVAAGDFGDCGTHDATLTAEIVQNTPGTVVTLGDTAYPHGSYEDFSGCYAKTWGRFVDRTKPAAGNHDYETENGAPYFDFFGERAGERDKGYYSYDLGSWHAIVLNSNCDRVGGCDSGSEQYRWLEEDLKSHPTDCTVTYWHHPLFSSGNHGQDRDMRDIWRALYAHGTELVINGHDHDYERLEPINPDGKEDPQGIRQFVVGTGGSKLRGTGARDRNSEVFNSETHGVLKVTLLEGKYRWEFIPVDGKSFKDSGSGVCVNR